MKKSQAEKTVYAFHDVFRVDVNDGIPFKNPTFIKLFMLINDKIPTIVDVNNINNIYKLTIKHRYEYLLNTVTTVTCN